MKIIYDTQTGNILAHLIPKQDELRVLSNFSNAQILEIETQINEQSLFDYKLNLDTLELEPKPKVVFQ